MFRGAEFFLLLLFTASVFTWPAVQRQQLPRLPPRLREPMRGGTNAKRLARGLPPLPPVRRASTDTSSRPGPSASLESTSTTQTSSSPGPTISLASTTLTSYKPTQTFNISSPSTYYQMGVWSAGAVAIGAAAANLAPLGVLGVFTGMGAWVFRLLASCVASELTPTLIAGRYGLVPLTAGAAGAAAGAAAGSAAGAAAAVGALMLVPDLKFSLWFSVKDVNAPPCHQFFSILVEKGGSIANGDVNFLGNSEKTDFKVPPQIGGGVSVEGMYYQTTIWEYNVTTFQLTPWYTGFDNKTIKAQLVYNVKNNSVSFRPATDTIVNSIFQQVVDFALHAF